MLFIFYTSNFYFFSFFVLIVFNFFIIYLLIFTPPFYSEVLSLLSLFNPTERCFKSDYNLQFYSFKQRFHMSNVFFFSQIQFQTCSQLWVILSNITNEMQQFSSIRLQTFLSVSIYHRIITSCYSFRYCSFRSDERYR